jgi:hypothetical protein
MNNIYMLKDPRTNSIRYVGVTVQSLRARLHDHVSKAMAGENTHKAAWIRILLSHNLKPCIYLIEETPDRLRERYWINYFLLQGCDLTNCTEGGDGALHMRQETKDRIRKALVGRSLLFSTRIKMSESHKGRSLSSSELSKFIEMLNPRVWTDDLYKTMWLIGSGHKHSDETKKQIGEASKNRKRKPHTEETKLKISASRKGKPLSEEHRHSISEGHKRRFANKIL